MPSNIFIIIRRVIVIGLFLASYGLRIRLIGREGKILESLLASIAVFVTTLYLSHETQYFEGYVSGGIITLCTLNLIGGFILGQSVRRFVGMIIAHVGIFSYHQSIIDELINRIRISSYRVCTNGVSIRSVTLTATLAVFFVATYSSFGITCSQLRTQSDQIISSISLKKQRNVVENFVVSTEITKTIGSFFQTSIGDIVQGTSAITAQPIVGDLNHTNIDLSTLPYQQEKQTSISVLQKKQESSIIEQKSSIKIDPREDKGGWEMTHNTANIQNQYNEASSDYLVNNSNKIRQGSIVGTIDYLRHELIDKTVSDTKLIDQKVCDFIVELIGQKYSEPGFKISVVVLLRLLLVPFIRILIWIIALLNWIIYLIIHRIGIYRIVPSWIETQEMI